MASQGLSPGSKWRDARVDGRAVPLYAPDDATDPAYWEVRVRARDGRLVGWLVLGTREDDFPVPLAAEEEGRSPSEDLRARVGPGRRIRVFYIDGGTFVAEGEDGEALARIGSLPPRIAGVDPNLHARVPEEERLVRIAGDRIERGPSAPLVELAAWPSWRAFRAEYAEHYRLQIDARREAARADWDADRAHARGHWVLGEGEELTIPLLGRPVTSVRVDGDASAPAIEQRDAVLRVRGTTTAAPATRNVAIAYGDGTRETFRFTSSVAKALFAQVRATAPTSKRGPVTAVAPVSCPRLALRATSGHFVRAVNGGGGAIRADADTIVPHAIFTAVSSGTDAVTLRAPNGSFVGVDPATKLLVADRTADRAERFRFEVVKGEESRLEIAGLRALGSNKYVMAENAGGGAVKAAGNARDVSETFTLVCDPTGVSESWAAGGSTRTQAWAVQRKYKQLEAKTGLNISPCASGCGPTVWAMLIGYYDLMAHQRLSGWSHMTRLYLAGGGRGPSTPDEVAPEWNTPGIEAITWELNRLMDDAVVSGCGPNGRWTAPHIMAQANQYFWGRAPARVIADYDGTSARTAIAKAKVEDSLRRWRRPVAVGVGFFAHYPLAFGLRTYTARIASSDRAAPNGLPSSFSQPVAESRMEVNWGHGEGAPRNIPTSTWFHGILDAAPAGRVGNVARDCTVRNTSGPLNPGRVDYDYKCRTQLRNDERYVAMEVAEELVQRDIAPRVRTAGRKVCLLKSTDVQCAPCSTTDRLIVRMSIEPVSKACSADTYAEIR